jgi:hypothetical protein
LVMLNLRKSVQVGYIYSGAESASLRFSMLGHSLISSGLRRGDS